MLAIIIRRKGRPLLPTGLRDTEFCNRIGYSGIIRGGASGKKKGSEGTGLRNLERHKIRSLEDDDRN
jgi:hypothetical protein